MTDTIALDDRLHQDARDALSAQRWLTPREVHAKAPQWPMDRLRHALRDMAERSEIETRTAGTADRTVREYRAWK
jgi:hypothetical protein